MTKFKKFVFILEQSYVAENIDDANEQRQNESEGWYVHSVDYEFNKTVKPSAEEIQDRLDEIKYFEDWCKAEDEKEIKEAEQKCSKCGENPN